MVAAAVCSVPGSDTLYDGAAGAGTVSVFCGSLQTPSGAALKIVPC